MASAKGINTGGKRKSVTAHPVFRAYVALWFAGLLGLSSLAVGVPNLERATAALNLQLYLPAAAPPLGMTARALIAAAASGLGLCLGYLIARAASRGPKRPAAPRAAASEREEAEPPVAVRARDIHPDAPVRRPIFAHEEFGESLENEDAEAVQDMAALRAARLAEPEPGDLALPSFLMRSGQAPELSQPEAEAEPAPVVIDFEPAEPAQPEIAAAVEEVAVEAPTTDPVVQDIVPAPFDLPSGEAARRIVSAELSDLSPVELLERFAIALQRRQSRVGKPMSDEQAARIAALGETALALGREALADLDRVSGPTPAVRPVAIELPPLRKRAAAKQAAPEPALEADVEPEGDVGPEVALKRFVTRKAKAEQAAARPIAAEAPKGFAVVPPAPAASGADDPDQTEKALRTALAALQRMTGTA